MAQPETKRVSHPHDKRVVCKLAIKIIYAISRSGLGLDTGCVGLADIQAYVIPRNALGSRFGSGYIIEFKANRIVRMATCIRYVPFRNEYLIAGPVSAITGDVVGGAETLVAAREASLRLVATVLHIVINRPVTRIEGRLPATTPRPLAVVIGVQIVHIIVTCLDRNTTAANTQVPGDVETYCRFTAEINLQEFTFSRSTPPDVKRHIIFDRVPLDRVNKGTTVNLNIVVLGAIERVPYKRTTIRRTIIGVLDSQVNLMVIHACVMEDVPGRGNMETPITVLIGDEPKASGRVETIVNIRVGKNGVGLVSVAVKK